MSLTAPQIAIKSKEVGKVVLEFTDFDATADSHDIYRSTASMAGDPEANGTLIGQNVDPTLDFEDTTVDPMTTYYWQPVSRGEGSEYGAETTEYINRVEADSGEVQNKGLTDADFNFLVSNSLLSAVRFGVAPYAGMTLRNDDGTLYASKAYNYKGTPDAVEETASNQYKLVDGIWRCDTASSTYFRLHEIKPNSIYFRFWYNLDYATSTSNPNHEITGMGGDSNDGIRLRFDSDRPRSYLDFSDGSTGSRESVLPGGWSLHEAWYDYDNSQWRWVVSRATYASNDLQTINRSSGATIAWGSGTSTYSRTPRGQGNVSFPTSVGSYFILETIPSAAVREAWYDLDKARYGY